MAYLRNPPNYKMLKNYEISEKDLNSLLSLPTYRSTTDVMLQNKWCDNNFLRPIFRDSVNRLMKLDQTEINTSQTYHDDLPPNYRECPL